MVRTLRERRLADFIATILADGERAAYWAEHCGWVPGTESCPGIPVKACQEECFFREWRDREAMAFRRARQRRRRVQISAR